MRTLAGSVTAFALFFGLGVGCANGQAANERAVIHIRGEVLSLSAGQAALVAMLEAEEPERRDEGLKALDQNLRWLIGKDGLLLPEVRKALATCYSRFPPFPQGTQLTKANAMEIFGGGKVCAFTLLAQRGGEEGQALMKAALEGDDTLMREIALKVRELPGGVPSGGLTPGNANGAPDFPPEVGDHESIASLAGRVLEVLGAGTPESKQQALLVLRRRRVELRSDASKQLRQDVVAATKRQVVDRKDAEAAMDMLTAIADLDEKEAAAKFLSEFADNPKMPRYLRSHARYVGETLALGVFR